MFNRNWRFFWLLLLVLLVAANVIFYWPTGQQADSHREGPGLPPGGAPMTPSPKMQERMDAALAKLPEAERAAATARLASDRAFFDSVKALPEAERREKMKEFFDKNPPPNIPGLMPPDGTAGGGGNGPGGPDGPGGPGNGPMHIPEPEQRRSMDQHIADQQKSNTGT